MESHPRPQKSWVPRGRIRTGSVERSRADPLTASPKLSIFPLDQSITGLCPRMLEEASCMNQPITGLCVRMHEEASCMNLKNHPGTSWREMWTQFLFTTGDLLPPLHFRQSPRNRTSHVERAMFSPLPGVLFLIPFPWIFPLLETVSPTLFLLSSNKKIRKLNLIPRGKE